GVRRVPPCRGNAADQSHPPIGTVPVWMTADPTIAGAVVERIGCRVHEGVVIDEIVVGCSVDIDAGRGPGAARIVDHVTIDADAVGVVEEGPVGRQAHFLDAYAERPAGCVLGVLDDNAAVVADHEALFHPYPTAVGDAADVDACI